jgi:hypothetical protein
MGVFSLISGVLKKNCHGIIETSIHENMEDICWKCNQCTNAGIIKNVFGD